MGHDVEELALQKLCWHMGIRVHAAFSPSRGMVKSQCHNDKGFNMQIPNVTMQHTNGGW